MFGKPPPSMANYIPGTTQIEAVDVTLADRDHKLKVLKRTLIASQQRMKAQADKHRTDVVFAEGDLVLVKLQPYRQQSVAKRYSPKLSKKYFGPFPVLQQIGAVAYKLQLPEESQIHPVFHVSLLKRYLGEKVPTPVALPPMSLNNHPIIQPLAVVGERSRKINNNWVSQILIQWQGLPLEEATWMTKAEFQALYPNFHLEDKVDFEGVGIDAPSGLVNVTLETDGLSLEKGNLEWAEEEMLEETKLVGPRKSSRSSKKPGWLNDYI